MKKKFMGIALVLASALFVGNVHAEWNKESYGVVSKGGSDTYLTDPKVTVAHAEGVKDNTITFASGDFVLIKEDTNSAGVRIGGNSWVGVKVTLPTGVDQNGYQVYIDGKEHTEGLFNTSDYTEWFAISETRLNDTLGGKIVRTLEFDWDKKDGIDQTVTIEIDTMNISVYEEGTTKDTMTTATPIWSPAIAQTKLEEKQAKEETEKLAAEQAKVAEVVSVEDDGVSVSGTMLPETDSVYKTMLEKVTGKGFKTVFGAYELTTESKIGENGITLTFKVGIDNNGKAALVLHKKADGSFEEFEGVVKDGVVKITVKELSPFMIALGDVVKDDAPGTNDIFPIALIGIITLGLAGTYTYKKIHE